MTIATDPTEPSPRRCPRHGPVSPNAPEGLCPRCLLDPEALGDVEEEPAPQSFPVRFGPYEILSKLGEGGMGVVYRARQTSIDRVVALKRIRDGELADAAARRRFHREAMAAARLEHPHVVPIYEVGEHEGQPYFTMKLMGGGTLADAAARFAEPRRAARLVATLARAVHAGHRQRILHRDLKPENILFDDRDEPYVADFGVAKRLDRDGSTSVDAIVGSACYMAPEQASRQAAHDTVAADVWSLGVILYELLAGRRPFEGATLIEVLRRAHEEEPEPLEVLRREVGRDLSTVCLTCLRKEPERRYISAEALADDLDRYLRGEPPAARRPGPGERALAWCRRHRAATALLATATLALLTLTLWAFAGARAQEQARRAEVLAANTYAARAVAGTVLTQLDEYADQIAKEARDPALVAATARRDADELLSHFWAIHARHPGIASWFLVYTDGFVGAHVPHGKMSLVVNRGRSFAFRDYFRGAMSMPRGADRPVYVSRASRSKTDHEWKLAMTSPIRGEDGAVLGVLAAEIPTDRRLGALELSDDRRIAVLAVRRDREAADEPLPDEHVLLAHSRVEHGEGVLVESPALRRLAARRDAAGARGHDQLRLPPPTWVDADDDYHDPLGARDHGGTGGPWLAGVAAVGGTELSVIVQTRLEDATALDARPLRVLVAWSVGGAVLLFAGLFAALRSPRRRQA
ncbi:MAG: serine/threonine protein kinase [Minicystis sp.]